MKDITVIILTVTCSCFIVVVLLIFCYYYFIKKANQVSPESAYLAVADSSFSNIFDSVMPQQVYNKKHSKNPCCICFDK